MTDTEIFEQHVSAQIDDRIEGKTFVGNAEIYSTLDHTTPSYVRDTECWTSDISNITAIAVANEFMGDSRRSGILISPRHVMVAHHYDIPADNWIRFVGSGNTIYEYDVLDTLHLDGLYGSIQDIELLYLDSDVDSSLGFAKVLPSGALSWLDNEADVPVFTYDVRLGGTGAPFLPRATVVENSKFVSTSNKQIVLTPDVETHPQRYEFYDSKETGDSGCPMCLIVNGELVLLATFWFPTYGTSVMALYEHVNTAMSTLSSDNGGGDNYQLTDVEFSYEYDQTIAGKWIL